MTNVKSRFLLCRLPKRSKYFKKKISIKKLKFKSLRNWYCIKNVSKVHKFQHLFYNIKISHNLTNCKYQTWETWKFIINQTRAPLFKYWSLRWVIINWLNKHAIRFLDKLIEQERRKINAIKVQKWIRKLKLLESAKWHTSIEDTVQNFTKITHNSRNIISTAEKSFLFIKLLSNFEQQQPKQLIKLLFLYNKTLLFYKNKITKSFHNVSNR